MSGRLYADHNAAAPLRPEAREAMVAALDLGGNPSSVHAEGRRARAALEAARETLASLVSVRAQDLVFTSGATEGVQLAFDAALAAGFGPVFVSAMEHDALAAYAPIRAPDLKLIPAREDGLADLDWLEAELAAAGGRPLVALQAANNETGAIQAIGRVARLLEPLGGALLVDSAQAFGKLGAGAWAGFGQWTVLSSHKVGGPAGVGAIAVQAGAAFPVVRPGGGQERGRRAGAPNLVGAIGFAAAATAACAEVEREQERWCAERDGFEAAVQAARPDAVIFAEWALRLANTSCFAVPGVSAERALIALDLAGAAVSTGAACSSGTVKPSRVLAAMGVDPSLAMGALRVSFGWTTRPGDGERLAHLYLRSLERPGDPHARR